MTEWRERFGGIIILAGLASFFLLAVVGGAALISVAVDMWGR